MVSRFAQLLLLALLVIFVPTLLYLRPTSPSRYYEPGSHNWYGAAGSVPAGSSSSSQSKGVQSSQGNGPLANDDKGSGEWSWPNHLLEPAKLKAGDYWRSWNQSWKTSSKGSGGGGSSGDGHGQKAAADVKAATTAATAAAATNTVVAIQGLPDATGGSAFAAKMGNATAKAELGRATWRFLHTMTLRFPDHPTQAQRQTLDTFIHTFALLYPCGECANHFQQLLKEMPPQTSSRMAASLWLCAAHNRVNARLEKPEFPCDKLDETYDCGCGTASNTTTASTSKIAATTTALPAADQPPFPERAAAGDASLDWLQARNAETDSCGLCHVRS